MEEGRYLSYGQAYLFSNGMIGMVSADEMAENPVEQETDALGTRIFLWERRRNSPTRDDFGSFSGMLEAYGVEETGNSEEDFYHLSLEAERRGERLYPVGIYEHSLIRYYLDSVTDRNQTIDGVAILDKEKLRQINMPPEEYLKSVLETLTDWTNGEVYCVDMYTPKIVLDSGEVFAKLIPDYETMDPIRELYAPKTSDLKEYLPDGVSIADLIGETFYSIDQLRNFIERPENGLYLGILEKTGKQRDTEKQRDEVEEQEKPDIGRSEDQEALPDSGSEKKALLDHTDRLKRALLLPAAVSETLLKETLDRIRVDAEGYGWGQITERLSGDRSDNNREKAREVLFVMQDYTQKQESEMHKEKEQEQSKRNGQGMDI